jgi:hypothetical protein
MSTNFTLGWVTAHALSPCVGPQASKNSDTHGKMVTSQLGRRHPQSTGLPKIFTVTHLVKTFPVFYRTWWLIITFKMAHQRHGDVSHILQYRNLQIHCHQYIQTFQNIKNVFTNLHSKTGAFVFHTMKTIIM